MARGNCVLITPEPKGRFDEGTIIGTPKPGVCVTLKPGTTFTNGGRPEFEPAGATATIYMGADGDRIPIGVLLDSASPGGMASGPYRDYNTAFASGDRCAVYYPVPGDELNMWLQDNTGTGALEDFTVGVKLIVDDGTGKLLQTTGTPEAEAFQCNELKTDLAADYFCHVTFTGY